jgi:hypothetical protein
VTRKAKRKAGKKSAKSTASDLAMNEDARSEFPTTSMDTDTVRSATHLHRIALLSMHHCFIVDVLCVRAPVPCSFLFRFVFFCFFRV